MLLIDLIHSMLLIKKTIKMVFKMSKTKLLFYVCEMKITVFYLLKSVENMAKKKQDLVD